MEFDDVTPMVQNIIIMDSEGKRIAVKYYSDEWCGFLPDGTWCSRVQERSLEHARGGAGVQLVRKQTSRRSYLQRSTGASNEAWKV